MNRVKLMCYSLLAAQFLFFVWLLSSMIVDDRFTDQKFNGSTVVFELILASVMIFGAIYLKLMQLKEITKN